MCPRLTKYISTYLLTVVAAHVGCLVVSAAAADLGDQEAEAEHQQEEDALVHGGGGGVTVRLRVAQLCDAATNLELDWNMLSSTLTGCLLPAQPVLIGLVF